MRAEERILPGALEAMRDAIADAKGNEVFFIGETDASGKVFRASPGARGHAEAVPALSPFLAKGNVVLHNHPSGGLTPSDADLRVASRWGNQGIGFFIVDNPVREVYVVAEPIGVREASLLDVQRLKALLSPSGPLRRILPSYEERPGQAGMLALVGEAFNEDELAAVEAGTGVGKSLAYLLPSLAWAEANEERVVISTATINLQQQLVEKDIPLAQRMLGSGLKAVLVKGRGNYLCRARLLESLEEANLFEEPDTDLCALKEWADATETGSRSDLSFHPKEEAWARVCSEADACLGLRCPFREGCFVMRSRREAASARVLVANHHLLFSDLAMRLSGSGFEDTAVLPPFQRIVFDEAHNIEKSASSFFSRSFSRFLLAKCLGRILKKRKGRVSGLYTALRSALGRNRQVTGIPRAVEDLGERAAALDGACLVLMGEEGTFLCQGEAGEAAFDAALAGPLGDFGSALLGFFHRLEEITARLPQEENDPLLRELRLQGARLRSLMDVLDAFRRRGESAESVFWTEAQKTSHGERFCVFTITPLSVAPLMREAVFQPFRTVIFTSATLTVGGHFGYWAGRIGLDSAGGRKPVCDAFPSPFDYGSRVLLAVPTDAPAPDQPEFLRYASAFLRKVLAQSGGRALVLFTSYSMLLSLYEAVRPAMDARGIPVYRQGEEDRGRLLSRFKDETASVLFATDSFWEGVDAPGETLSMVVICRLPFRVPSEPVLRARMEAIRRDGGNPFAQLSLPDAVVKLRQGFGRLMRRRDDGGVVLILDSRLANKPYGEVFLDSLPPSRRALLPTDRLHEAIASALDPE